MTNKYDKILDAYREEDGGTGSSTWGSITGTLSNQTDLQNALNLKIGLTSLSAGTGISYNNLTGQITNSAPDQTVSITAGTNIDSVTGTYPNFTINASTQGGAGVTEAFVIAMATAL
jgi:hypothetical protein